MSGGTRSRHQFMVGHVANETVCLSVALLVVFVAVFALHPGGCVNQTIQQSKPSLLAFQVQRDGLSARCT